MRERAARALGRTWSEAAIPPLVEALGDARATVRAAAADALGETWGDAAADALRLAATRDSSAQVRARALVRLSRLGADEAIGALALAAGDRSRRVQVTAAEILAVVGAP